MPAEWHPHAATWMAWPHDDEQWVGMLEPVRREFTAFVEAIATREPVDLLLADEDSEQDARRRLTRGTIRFHRVAHQDLWLRDSGPTFVTRGDQVALVDWEFNGWGDKYPADLDNQIPDPRRAHPWRRPPAQARHRHGGRVHRGRRPRHGAHDAPVPAVGASQSRARRGGSGSAPARGHRRDAGACGSTKGSRATTPTGISTRSRALPRRRPSSRPPVTTATTRTTRCCRPTSSACASARVADQPAVSRRRTADSAPERALRGRAPAADLRQLLHRQRRGAAAGLRRRARRPRGGDPAAAVSRSARSCR